MKKLNFKNLIIGLIAITFTITASAQNVYKLNEKNSKLTINGTSSLHDWEMEATEFSAETELKLRDGSVSGIRYIKFSAPVSKLESGKNIMDDKTHDALQEKKFPQIKFALKEGDKPQSMSGKNADLIGMLTLAGKTKEIKVHVDFTISSDRQFTVSGKVHLKMSDFGIDPPTAFFGSLKTGNEVDVEYSFEFNRSN